MGRQTVLRITTAFLLLFLLGCSPPEPPNDQQALAVVQQYLAEQGGIIEVHEKLGRIRRDQTTALSHVQVKHCRLVATQAFWCEFIVNYATAEDASRSGQIALRVERDDQGFRGVRF